MNNLSDLQVILFFLNFIPIIGIGYTYHLYESEKWLFGNINHQLEKDKGQGLVGEAIDRNEASAFWGGLGLLSIFGGFSINGVVGLGTLVLWFVSSICMSVVSYMEPIIISYNARQRERKEQPRQTAHNDFSQGQQSSNNNKSSEDEFNYNSGRWGNKGQTQDPNAPRGYENRHPDDAKFWAHVDDPTNPTHVREMWFKEIMKREKARSEGRNPDHEKDSDDVKRALLGILKKRSN